MSFSQPISKTGGRPMGPVRAALLTVLQQGVVGTFDALARHTGLPVHQVRCTLRNLRREGVVAYTRPHCAAQPQRARAIYHPASTTPAFDALRFVAGVWR